MAAQESPADAPPKLDWVTGLAGRFQQFHDPVVSTYALARLGGLICGKDQAAGAEIYRNALNGMRLLPADAFRSAKHRQPVPSFTSLYKLVTAGAGKCAQELKGLDDGARSRARMDEERRQANDNLRTAFQLFDNNPDRAAQLVEAAISSSDPTLLDIPSLTRFLSQLRERAADVADDLFPEALDFIASAEQPSPGLLLEFGKYLFTAPQYRDIPDSEQQSDVQQVGKTSITNFSANRKSSDSDEMHDYIEAAVKVVTATNDPFYDPVAAYAIVSQMIPKADEVAPDLAGKLRDALPAIAQQAGSAVEQIQAAIGGSQAADPSAGEGPQKRFRLMGRVRAETGMGHYAEARDLLKDVDDQDVRKQAGSIIDFVESGAALEKRDTQWAFTLANTLRGGVKRSLLYAGISAASGRDEAQGYFQLGLTDSKLLPAEQRMLTTAALASAMLPLDADNGMVALAGSVEAANDAYVSPHKGRFDPQIIHKIFSGKTDASTDSPLILANRRCLCEVVDTGLGRVTFPLKVPGVKALRLPSVIQGATSADPERLQSAILGLRDETQQAEAMLGWAELQFSTRESLHPR